jgi:3-oxoacyl-[acyl-carrier protein] reductase
VAVSYVSSAYKANALVRDIEKEKELGVHAAAFQADQGDPSQAEGLIQSVVERFGQLDILVNNAAVGYRGKTIDSPEIDNAAMDRQWAVNVTGVVANIRAAVKVMREGGRIISIGSGVATRAGFPGLADYAGTKAVIVGYSKGAARDLAQRNITVNVIQAGLMDTDMAAPLKEAGPVIFSSLAIQRYAKLEEVAAGVIFLASPAASYITGAVVDLDGGYSG